MVAHSCPNRSFVIVKQIFLEVWVPPRYHLLISSVVGHLQLGDSDASLKSRVYHSSILLESAGISSSEIADSLSTCHEIVECISNNTASSTVKS